MGEWSEYFEDFPEENPANYVGGEFNPARAQACRDAENKTTAQAYRDAESKAKEKLRSDQQKLDAPVSGDKPAKIVVVYRPR